MFITAKQGQRFNLMELLFGKIIIPLSYYIKGDLRFKYLSFYKKNLNKTRAEISSFQKERLMSLIRHAYNTVPYYRELFDKHKIKPDEIRNVEDLKKIPVLDKKTLSENMERLKSTRKYKLIRTFSGGSTGNKALIFKDKRYLEISAAVWYRDLYSVGISPGQKSAWVWGGTIHKESVKRRISEKLSNLINRKIVFHVLKYDDKRIVDWIKNSFNKFNPEYIYGYAGAIYEIAKRIRKYNIKIAPIKMIITTSERLEHRKFIENVFKCPVIDQYGCCEVKEVAIEDIHHVMHSADDFVIVEIDNDNKILLTPLESYGMPLIRYQVGDAGLVKKEKVVKKSQLPFNEFSIVIGRIYEVLKNKKNENVSGMLIKEHMAFEGLDINEFQLVQKSLDEAILNIVKDKFTKDKYVKRLKEIVKEVLGCAVVKVNYLKTFPVEPNGKRIAFKCEVGKKR